MLPILLANQINMCISVQLRSTQHVNSSMANSEKDQNTVCWLVNFNLANILPKCCMLIGHSQSVCSQTLQLNLLNSIQRNNSGFNLLFNFIIKTDQNMYFVQRQRRWSTLVIWNLAHSLKHWMPPSLLFILFFFTKFVSQVCFWWYMSTH